MANKNLRTRQKAIFRLELSPRQSRPRNPLVASAHLRAAGPHRKSASGRRQQQQRALKKLLGGGGD